MKVYENENRLKEQGARTTLKLINALLARADHLTALDIINLLIYLFGCFAFAFCVSPFCCEFLCPFSQQRLWLTEWNCQRTELFFINEMSKKSGQQFI